MGLLLAGAVAYIHLPVASMPAIEFPTIRINTSRPGADPATMAASVAAPLERRLGEIAGVTEMTSTSSLGSASISMQFDLNRSIDGAARDVQAALNGAAADLPTDLPQVPTFRKVNPAASPVLILALTSKTMPPSAMYDTADTVIGQRISQVEGVADVTVSGAEQPATRVQVDPSIIASLGISFEDVRNAIDAANNFAPIGSIDGASQTIILQSNRQMTEPRGLQGHHRQASWRRPHRAPGRHRQRGARNPQRPLLGPLQPRSRRSCLIITKQADANVIETVDRVKALLPELEAMDSGRHRHLDPVRPHRHHSRLRARHAVHLGLTIALVMAVVLVFLRRSDAHHRRRHHRATVARGHLRRHVGLGLLHQQPDARWRLP